MIISQREQIQHVGWLEPAELRQVDLQAEATWSRRETAPSQRPGVRFHVHDVRDDRMAGKPRSSAVAGR